MRVLVAGLVALGIIVLIYGSYANSRQLVPLQITPQITPQTTLNPNLAVNERRSLPEAEMQLLIQQEAEIRKLRAKLSKMQELPQDVGLKAVSPTQPPSLPTQPPSLPTKPPSLPPNPLGGLILTQPTQGPIPHYKYVFAIKTGGPDKSAKRDEVRKTWLKHLPPNCYYFFYVGNSAAQFDDESEKFRDIVFLNTDENNPKGARKRVLALFRWLATNLAFTYVIQVDDNTVINPFILESTSSSWKTRKLYRGKCYSGVQTLQVGQKIDIEYTDCPHYVPFCGSYVISEDIVHWIAYNPLSLRAVENEDVMLGGWLHSLAETRIDEDPAFISSRETPRDKWANTPNKIFLVRDLDNPNDFTKSWEIISNYNVKTTHV